MHTVSNFVEYFRPNCVVAAKRGSTALVNVKTRTVPSMATASVTATGGTNVTSVVKRTSTGKSSPFQTKDLESELRNYCLLGSKSSLNHYSLLPKIIQVFLSLISLLYIYDNNNSFD